MEVCKLEHIRKDYRMGEVVTPLKDVSLVVNKGDFIAVEGPSGMGKSTLLYVIGTLLKADDGKLFFEGKDVMSMSDREQTTLRGEKVGFLSAMYPAVKSAGLEPQSAITQGEVN